MIYIAIDGLKELRKFVKKMEEEQVSLSKQSWLELERQKWFLTGIASKGLHLKPLWEIYQQFFKIRYVPKDYDYIQFYTKVDQFSLGPVTSQLMKECIQDLDLNFQKILREDLPHLERKVNSRR